MDADELEEGAEAGQGPEASRARRDAERARRQVEQALATGSRVEIVEDDDGAELRVAPRDFLAALDGLDRPIVAFSLLQFLPVGLVLVAVPVQYAPTLAFPIAASGCSIYLIGFLIWLRWFLGASPLRIRVTSRGHAAVWHRTLPSGRPRWVGSRESLRIELAPYRTRDPKSKEWERRHGWTRVGYHVPNEPLQSTGPAFDLNQKDADTAREFLGRLGILL